MPTITRHDDDNEVQSHAPVLDADNDSVSKNEEEDRNSTSPVAYPVSKKERKNSYFTSPLFYWMVAIGVVSFVLRIIKIGFSDDTSPVFDEKHYVTQAKEMLLNGGIEDNPGFGLVVHPPLGKWLLAIGEAIAGYNPYGWRIIPVIAGVVSVLIISYIVYRVTSSLSLMVFAAVIANFEGVSLTMTRSGMLDAFVLFFVCFITLCAVMEMTTDNKDVPWHRHWWLLAAGIATGLMASVKISGFYYAAIFGVVFVLMILVVNGKNFMNTVKGFFMGLFYFAVMPLTIAFLSYVPWFSNESSVYRHQVQADPESVAEVLPSWLEWIPDAWKNFYYYQQGVFSFHTSLHSSAENFHPYESKPWEWLMSARPILFWSEKVDGSDLEHKIWLWGNPLVWYLLVPVFVYGIIALCVKNWKWIIPVSGLAVGWFPWIVDTERQMYFFYTIALVPFLIMGLCYIFDDINSWSDKRKDKKDSPGLKDKDDTTIQEDDSSPLEEETEQENDILDESDKDDESEDDTENVEDDSDNDSTRKIKLGTALSAIYATLVVILAIPYVIVWTYGVPVNSDIHEKLSIWPGWEVVTDDNVEDILSFG